ncbi:sugar ABC transporter substrate-binding protein [Vallitalea sediminicola]
MKKLLSLVLIISLMSIWVVGCGGKDNVDEGNNAKDNVNTNDTVKKYKIGVAGSSFADKWQTYLYDAIKEEADSLDEVEAIFTDAKDDSSIQIANMENLIAQKVDAIIVVMVDTEGAKPYVKMCEEAGIPLIGVNRTFEGADVYVGSESIQAGLMQMEHVVKLLGEKGNICVLEGAPGYEAAVQRTAGNIEIADKYEEINIIRQDTGKWDRAKGMEVAENWLQSGEEINAIVANNDEMAIGAIRALEAVGNTDIVVAGIDATLDALEYVKDGTLDITIFQSPFGQGSESLKAALKMAKGETVEEVVWVPFEIVNKENVDEYIAKWE